MSDRPLYALGDEIQCKRCQQWHVTYLDPPTYEAGSAARLEICLWFKCPKAQGPFYGGLIGFPVEEPDRWRRPTSA